MLRYSRFVDCPACHITNPPDSVRCDCGYDFVRHEPYNGPGWEISLSWSQKVAAYWAISWPALLATLLLLFIGAVTVQANAFRNELSAASSAGFLVYFSVQALLTRRLFRKKFRTFRLAVLREDETSTSEPSWSEAYRVWLWIFGPQLALSLALGVLLRFYGDRLAPDLLRSLSSISMWLRFLVVGPYAIQLAVDARYRGFRLQALSYRRT
ncbi:MAG: hypothetical protein J0H49_17055 [Acidobacteria bacterium]|nr:hypothetical protein [Acidobacteriota bacterium]